MPNDIYLSVKGFYMVAVLYFGIALLKDEYTGIILECLETILAFALCFSACSVGFTVMAYLMQSKDFPLIHGYILSGLSGACIGTAIYMFIDAFRKAKED